MGVSVAATVRVGNELGAGNPTAAKRAAYINLVFGSELCVYTQHTCLYMCIHTHSLSLPGVVAALSSVVFLGCRHELGKIFTSKQ